MRKHEGRICTLLRPEETCEGARDVALAHHHPLAEQVERDQDDIVAWAAERDLTVTFSEEPSWQDPGRAVLVIFEPRESAEGVALEQPVEPRLDTPAAPPTAPDLATLEPLELIALPDAEPDSAVPETAPDPTEDTDVTQPTPAPATVMRPIAPIDLGEITLSASRARRITSRLARCGVAWSFSNFMTVTSLTPAAFAKSGCV